MIMLMTIITCYFEIREKKQLWLYHKSWQGQHAYFFNDRMIHHDTWKDINNFNEIIMNRIS